MQRSCFPLHIVNAAMQPRWGIIESLPVMINPIGGTHLVVLSQHTSKTFILKLLVWCPQNRKGMAHEARHCLLESLMAAVSTTIELFCVIFIFHFVDLLPTMVHSCREGKMAGKKVNGAALEAFLKLLCVVLSGLGLESLCMYVCFDARRSLTGTNHGSQVHVSSSPHSCYFLVRFCLPAHCMALLVCGETLMMGRRVELWMASKSSAWETVLQCDSLGIFVSASCHVVMLSSNDC